MSRVESESIPVQALRERTGYRVEDDGDGVLGAGDRITKPNGDAVTPERARQDFFVARAQRELEGWSAALKDNRALPAGMEPPSKGALLQRAAEMQDLIAGRAGRLPPRVESDASLVKAGLLGTAADRFGKRFLGKVPDEETQARFAESFRATQHAVSVDPTSEAAWTSYVVTLVSTFDGTPSFYRDKMEAKLGVRFVEDLGAVVTALQRIDAPAAQLTLALVLTAVRNKDAAISEGMDPGGRVLKATLGRLAAKARAEPKAVREAAAHVAQGPTAEKLVPEILSSLAQR